MRMSRIQGMSEAVKGGSNIEKITLGMGKWVFIFFLFSLGALAGLKRFAHVKLSGKQIIIAALLIAIISAFGIMAGEILEKLTGILKTF